MNYHKIKWRNEQKVEPQLANTLEAQYLIEIENAMNVFIDEQNVHFVGESKGLPFVLTNSAFYVELVARFGSRFSAFQCLNRNDQMLLLKSAFPDVLSVRTAFSYNVQIDGFYLFEVSGFYCIVLDLI